MDLPGSCCQNNTLESNMDKGSESDNLDLVESITKAAVNCEGYLLDVSEGIHPNSMEDDKYVIDSDTVVSYSLGLFAFFRIRIYFSHVAYMHVLL